MAQFFGQLANILTNAQQPQQKITNALPKDPMTMIQTPVPKDIPPQLRTTNTSNLTAAQTAQLQNLLGGGQKSKKTTSLLGDEKDQNTS